MKKVINGVLYNTDTAEYLGCSDNGYLCNDFHYAEECLYRTKKGKFFLFGQGNGLSRYAQRVGNGFCSGERIEALSDREALSWASYHLDGDEVEDIFGITEDLPENAVPVTIMIAKKKADVLKKEADAKNVSLSQLISEILDKQAV